MQNFRSRPKIRHARRKDVPGIHPEKLQSAIGGNSDDYQAILRPHFETARRLKTYDRAKTSDVVRD